MKFKVPILLIISILLIIKLAPVGLTAPPLQDGGQDYVVQVDDWLSKLADKFYGNIFAFPAIVEATNTRASEDSSYAFIANPDVIEVGQKLYIPSADEAAILLGNDVLSATGHSANTQGFPITIENCGLTITVDTPPQRAVTMNQSATEIMLALGLQDKMVGTAYIDDEILPEYADAYNAIPVLSDQYPSQEVLFDIEPDFIYGSFASAFGDSAAGPRQELMKLGIATYLSPFSCEDLSLRPTMAMMNIVYREILDIGRIFGVSDRAEALVDEMKADLEAVKTTVSQVDTQMSVFWFDSGDDQPFVGAGSGVPNLLIELAGGKNIFGDVEGSWATVSWEEVIARDADAIVVIEADWSTAQEKIDLLTNTPTYADIKAVQAEHFIIIPFSNTTAGVRNATTVRMVAKGLYPEIFQ